MKVYSKYSCITFYFSWIFHLLSRCPVCNLVICRMVILFRNWIVFMNEEINLYSIDDCLKLYLLIRWANVSPAPIPAKGSFALESKWGEVVLVPNYSHEEIKIFFDDYIEKNPGLYKRYQSVFGRNHEVLSVKKSDPIAILEALCYMIKLTF